PPAAEEPPPAEEPQPDVPLPEPPQAGDGEPVVFTFTHEYTSGDFYEGFGYADQASGFAPGAEVQTVDENGQISTYRITSVEPQGAEPGPAGFVVITNYFDAETASSLPASGSGSGGLGSEAGHVFDQSGAFVGSFNSQPAADGPDGAPPAPEPPAPQ
ncbi:MAG: hypothetical protein HQL39_18000, partial [Alphaproteobacteria bacterium]|nr:hypothetical protein [Alphaproteobacteria bacterium]